MGFIAVGVSAEWIEGLVELNRELIECDQYYQLNLDDLKAINRENLGGQSPRRGLGGGAGMEKAGSGGSYPAKTGSPLRAT